MIHVGNLKAHDLELEAETQTRDNPARAPKGLLKGIAAGAALWIAAIMAMLLLR